VPPVFQTKEDCVLDGREWRKETDSEPLEVADTLYADGDTGGFFKTRADAVQDVPLLVKFLAKFGLFVHVKLPGQKKSKSVLMYHSAPKASYREGLLDLRRGVPLRGAPTTSTWEAGQASTSSPQHRTLAVC
jgi:hypothetical protein